ncbi:MAG: fumarate hydratase [Candidatus Omnitrophica bacterium]|nr:fumarate hydratase [Candidatus Omnitrophota bacterium]
MKKIDIGEIKDTICQLALEANFVLRRDIYRALNKAYLNEDSERARGLLKILIENAKIAKKEKFPICQDTGMVVVFLKIGEEIEICGGDLIKAINEGVRKAYKKGYLRKSICEPLSRLNTHDNTPAVVYVDMVKGDNLEIKLCIKGFGAENKSQIKMFEPTAKLKEIKGFIIKVVKEAGPDACPPFVVGVGMGGTFEKAAILAKEATLLEIRNPRPFRASLTQQRWVAKSETRNEIKKLEEELYAEINKLDIGPMGLGGKTTCLGVNILTFPTHIAGLPVAVNISCHATRSATKTL